MPCRGSPPIGGRDRSADAVASNGGYWLEGGPTFQQLGIAGPRRRSSPSSRRTISGRMGVPLKRGRDFTDGDRLDAPLVAIINESLARASFPGQDPIGRRIQCGLDTLDFMTIVGVVGDVRTCGPPAARAGRDLHALRAAPGSRDGAESSSRAPSCVDPLCSPTRCAGKSASAIPDVPVRGDDDGGDAADGVGDAALQTFLLVVFAGVALLLALAGVYGVMAYTVSQRVPELGLRIALGATPEQHPRLVLGHGASWRGPGW